MSLNATAEIESKVGRFGGGDGFDVMYACICIIIYVCMHE